jgi:hypothetical protein
MAMTDQKSSAWRLLLMTEQSISTMPTDTRRQGFLNGDGNSWASADGKLVARHDSATGKIEIAPLPAKQALPVTAGSNPSDAGGQQSGINQTEKPTPEPAPGSRPAPGTEPADQCQPTGKVPPSEVEIRRLIAEHNQAGEHLTHAAAISIIEQTQPDNTTATIVGKGVPGPDINLQEL